jgi:hypothetical protein
MVRAPLALTALALTVAVAACGSSHSSASLAGSKSSAAAPKAPLPVATTTTTTAPPPTPAELDQGACRAFVSFDEILTNAGDAASEAYGQVGGMIEQAQAAETAAPGQSGAATLLTDLQALSTLITSAQWTGAPAEAATPQVTAVAADCKSFPTN